MDDAELPWKFVYCSRCREVAGKYLVTPPRKRFWCAVCRSRKEVRMRRKSNIKTFLRGKNSLKKLSVDAAEVSRFVFLKDASISPYCAGAENSPGPNGEGDKGGGDEECAPSGDNKTQSAHDELSLAEWEKLLRGLDLGMNRGNSEWLSYMGGSKDLEYLALQRAWKLRGSRGFHPSGYGPDGTWPGKIPTKIKY